MPIDSVVERMLSRLKRGARKAAVPALFLASMMGAPAPASAGERNLQQIAQTEASVDSVREYITDRLTKATAWQATAAAQGSVFYVDSAAAPGGNGRKTMPYQTINAAISAATPGDRIIVLPGTYTENIAMPDSIAIYGRSKVNTTIVGTITATGTKGWYLSTFKLKSPTQDANFGLNATAAAEGVVEDVILEDYLAGGIVRNGARVIFKRHFGYTGPSGGDIKVQDTGSEAIVIGCTFSGDTLGTSSSLVAQGGANLIVDSNVIARRGGYAVAANTGASVTSLYNIFDKNLSGTHFGALIGATDRIVDPLFVGGPQRLPDSYRLQPGSPAINKGNPNLKNPDNTPLDVGFFFVDSTYVGGTNVKGKAIDTLVIDIPIKTDFLGKGVDVLAVELGVEYDPTKYTAVGVVTDGTLSSGRVNDYNLDDIPRIWFTTVYHTPLAGTGTLVKLKFVAETAFPTTDTLKVREFWANEARLIKAVGMSMASVNGDSIPPLSLQDIIIASTPNYGDANQDTVVTASDASTILRYTVRKQTLTPEQIAAADVSGVSGATPFDAALILRYVAGVISRFPVEGTPKEVSSTISPLLQTRTDDRGEFLDYRISGQHLHDTYAFHFRLSHDPSLELAQITAGEGWNLDSYDRGGKTEIALAGVQPLTNEIITVRYRKKDRQDGQSAISLEGAVANEQEIAVQQESPRQHRLNQNYPNPFNPMTSISYELPKAADVRLQIYNTAGQLVRTLINTRQEEGRYTATWNGTNDHGERVASGIYIYRLDAGKFTTARKMALVK
ncbi:T9SS type A sorting domain-containing protein [Candidatus Woesearchaeota archaeon]|nr:T9SS type A sorting domain-containing protein [Candidatus Woesearchaeota archaeon]